jgi:hypothetical protein
MHFLNLYVLIYGAWWENRECAETSINIVKLKTSFGVVKSENSTAFLYFVVYFFFSFSCYFLLVGLLRRQVTECCTDLTCSAWYQQALTVRTLLAVIDFRCQSLLEGGGRVPRYCCWRLKWRETIQCIIRTSTFTIQRPWWIFLTKKWEVHNHSVLPCQWQKNKAFFRAHKSN